MTEGKATQRFKPYQFVLEHEGLTHAEFSRKYEKGTITKFLFDNNLVEECISWLKVGTGGICVRTPISLGLSICIQEGTVSVVDPFFRIRDPVPF